MISIKNKLAIEKMSTAGKKLATILDQIVAELRPGVRTAELDAWIGNKLKQEGLVSMSKGYHGYKHVSCVSVNDEVVHGIPGPKVIKGGDLVKIDVCASWQGYCADMARCYFIEKAPADLEKLVDVAQKALNKGIERARAGNRVSDISAAIQEEIELHGFGIVRTFAGHGIGKQMHEEPEILNYGKPGRGAVLRPGMTLAIEPMITTGSHDVYVEQDGWTVRTKDKGYAAHVEDTVLITESAPKILTRL